MDSQLRQRVSLKNPWHFLALGFGSGLAPFMPGTFGTIAGLPIVYAISVLPPAAYAVIALVCCWLGIRICDRTARDMGVHDHGSIVWDEVAGILITFLLIPITPFTLVYGFILFRLFDIVKPWPISYLDKNVHGGLGIMLDDIAAGFLACTCLHAVLDLKLLPI